MESTLFLGINGAPLPILSRYPSSFSSPITTPTATRLKFPGQSYTICRPSIIRAIESSKNNKQIWSNNNMAGMGASIALGCVIGLIGFGYHKLAIAGPRELSRKAPLHVPVIYPLGGRLALKSLLDVSVYLSSSKLGPPQGPRYRLPKRPSMADANNDIKMEAVKLIKYGKEKEAVSLLQEAYKSNKHDPEPAYHVEMALVEILIAQGRYEEALKCNCLNDNSIPSDGRLPLYKAIIYTMLDKKDEAKKWWEDYIKTIEGGIGPPNPSF